MHEEGFMNVYRPWIAVALVASLGLVTGAGCAAEAKRDSSPETRGTPPPGADKGSDEPGSTEAKVEEAGRDLKDAAKDAGQKVEQAAEGLAPKVDAAKQLADIKMALMADPDIDGTKIDVDAEEATKTIHLKGRVPTAAQKSAAERIARAKAEGWKIHNMLTVGRS
jgi:multidrug efflux pump subunit AcrA (membrane-fusion protein)